MNGRRRGFTLVEIMIAMSMATILLLAGYYLMDLASTVYHRISGHEDGALQLKKASRQIQKDLLASYAGDLKVETVPGPGGFGGDAMSMLSSSTGDDAKGPVCNTESGAPFWQRNVIYYTTRPLGDPCTGGPDADGYEDMCPHKALLRKAVDSELVSRPLPLGNSASDKEKILASLTPYLTRPTNLSTASMLSEPNLTFAEMIGVGLLTMRVELAPEPNAPGEVKVTLKAFNEPSSRRTTAIGSTLLGDHEKTLTHVISVFPRNNQ